MKVFKKFLAIEIDVFHSCYSVSPFHLVLKKNCYSDALTEGCSEYIFHQNNSLTADMPESDWKDGQRCRCIQCSVNLNPFMRILKKNPQKGVKTRNKMGNIMKAGKNKVMWSRCPASVFVCDRV